MRLVATPRARWLIAAILGTLAFSALLFTFQSVSERDAQIVSFSRAADTSKIVVSVGVGYGDEVVGSHVVEDAKSVRVTVRVRHDMGSYPAILFFLPVVVPLHSVLLDRTVLDAAGNPVRDLGYYQAIPTR